MQYIFMCRIYMDFVDNHYNNNNKNNGLTLKTGLTQLGLSPIKRNRIP